MCNIRLSMMDFDDVLTDTKVFVLENEEEAVVCDKSDGVAVRELKKLMLNYLFCQQKRMKLFQCVSENSVCLVFRDAPTKRR